jgi:carbamoyl-phosphate synthase large subunit
MIKNILITSAGGDIGGNIIKILIKQNIFKCNLIATDINEHIFSEKAVDKFYIVSRTDCKEYLDEIKNIVTLNQVDLIIPSSEQDILFFNMYKEYFITNDIKLLINTDKIIKTFLDKFQTSLSLNNINVKTPITYNLEHYNGELNFPLIVKAIKSTTSKLIKIIINDKELDDIKEMITNKIDFLIQEYISTDNEEYTTAIYRDINISKVITFKRKLDGDKTGYAEIRYSKVLEDYANKIADKFSLNGSINIQSRMLKDDFYIFEINPRISSTVYIRNHFNFQDLVWWVCSILEVNFIYTIKENNKRGIAVIGYTYNFYK